MSSIHIILVVVYLIMMEPSGVGISESNVVYQYDIPISPTLCGYILVIYDMAILVIVTAVWALDYKIISRFSHNWGGCSHIFAISEYKTVILWAYQNLTWLYQSLMWLYLESDLTMLTAGMGISENWIWQYVSILWTYVRLVAVSVSDINISGPDMVIYL